MGWEIDQALFELFVIVNKIIIVDINKAFTFDQTLF